MNQVIEAIHGRRSKRFYDSKEISDELIRGIIDAGNAAPNGLNQAWRFVVVRDKEILSKMRELAQPKYHEWMEQYANDGLKQLRSQIDAAIDDPVYYNAPAVVFVISSAPTSDNDCPMVCQNMMLAAHSLGIGSCWVYFGQLILGDLQIASMLKLQEGEKVYGPILLGYTKGEELYVSQRKEAEALFI